jgi:hypothetical protein
MSVVFVVKFRSEDEDDGIRGLRQILKHAWRQFGLKCISVEKEQIETKNTTKPETLLSAQKWRTI